jgi:CHAT domain-containing protein/tetratricopeptide (TPR) repeat protein
MNLSAIICPHCQAKLRPNKAPVPGKSIRCPRCQESFMPEAPAHTPPPLPAPQPPSERVLARTAAHGQADEPVVERADTVADEQDSRNVERPRKKKRAKKKRAASRRRVLWIAGLGALGVVLVTGALVFLIVKLVAPPVIPPWQRPLVGADERNAGELTKQMMQSQAAGKFDKALAAAEELAQLRKKRQGKDHWQAVNASWQVKTIKRVQGLPQQSQGEYASIFAIGRQIQALGQERARDAQPLLEQLLAIRKKVLGEEHPDTAQSYNMLARSLLLQGKFVEAEASYRKALAIRQKLLGEEHPDTAQSYDGVASSLHLQSKFPEAQEDYRKALAIRRKVLGEEHPDTAQSYNNMARNQHELGQYAEAEEGFHKSLAIRQKVLGEEHAATAESYNNVAFNLQSQGKFAEAEPGLRHALAIYRKVRGEEHLATAQAYMNVAMNLHGQGKYAEAEENDRKALAIDRRVAGEEHPSTAQGYNDVALNLNAQGKYAEAEAGYRKALAIRKKVLGEEHTNTAVSYKNVASNLDSQGRYAEAEPGYRKALAIAQKAYGEEHPDTAHCYNSLALNLSRQGKYAEAEEGFHKALTIFRKVLGEENPYTARAYNNVAFNLQSQAKYAQAEEGFRQALAILRKVLGEENPKTAHIYNNVALSLNAQGKYAEAEEGFHKALAIRKKVLGEEHPDTAQSYNHVASNLHAQGKYAEAEQFWTLAADHFGKARQDIAASGLDRATVTGERSPVPSLAAVLARNGKPQTAWQRFEESLGRGTLDDLSARLRRPAAEQAKEAELVVHLGRLDQLIEKADSSNEPTNEQKKQRADLLTERRQVQDQLDAFGRYMEKTYGSAVGQVQDLAKIQAALPADTALVGWLDLPGQPQAADPSGEHWAFVLRSQGDPVVVALHGTGPNHAWNDADTGLPSELRSAFQSHHGNWQPIAERLGKQRLDPIASYLAAGHGLPAVKQLIVLPSTALAGVPVEAFAEGYTVSYALSGTLYAHLRHQQRSTSDGLLALADPVFERRGLDDGPGRSDNGTWSPLPGTRVEAEALRRLFPGQSSQMLTASEASEQRLYDLAQSGDLGKYRYLHFATHGTMDARFPLRSAIILSRDSLPDPGKQLDAGLPVFDGQLTAEEVLRQWHLGAELVTLSACQTALGKYERGEGFVGFAQALVLAGSRAVCLSLWKVDDTATALLMSRFYQNLLGKRDGLQAPMPKAAALAEAKEWLRGLSRAQAVQRTAQLGMGAARGKNQPALPLLPEAAKVPSTTKSEMGKDTPYAHPYYWAAFVLIGDPD